MGLLAINKCKCRQCGDVIESHRVHEWVSCKCGAIFTDGGHEYIRRGAMDLRDIIDIDENGVETEYNVVTGKWE